MNMSKIVFGLLLLMVFSVTEADAIDQSICSSGANVEFHPNGALKSCVLKENLSSKDFKCKSQGPVTSFYDNGQLEECVLAESATISGQKCNEFGPISFYRNGEFRSCLKKD